MIYVLFIVCIAEATVNSDHESAYKPTGYSAYLEDNEAIENLIAGIEDNDFYRIEKLSRKTKNDADKLEKSSFHFMTFLSALFYKFN